MGLHRIIREREIAEGQRVCREVEGRTVTLLRHRGKISCLDSLCYHQGGELGKLGDIEEVAGRIAITCPRHRHKIDIETGQRLDTDLEGCLRVEYGGESVQAVHSVHVDDGWVYVHITHVTGARSSSYNVVHEFVPNTQNNSINGGIAWGLSGDMFSPVKAPFDPLNDTISLSQNLPGSPVGEPLTQPLDGGSTPRAASPPEPPCPLEPYGGWGISSLGNIPAAEGRQQGVRGVVQMQSPQQQVTQMFRARSNAARMAVLRGKITAPTSYDVQHERVGAASEHRAVSGMKRSARTAEIPSPAKPPLQRMAGADENKHASPRRGLNFDLMDF